MPTATPSGQNTWILCVFSTLKFVVFFKKKRFFFVFIHLLWADSHTFYATPTLTLLAIRTEPNLCMFGSIHDTKEAPRPPTQRPHLSCNLAILRRRCLTWLPSCSPLASACLNSPRLPCLVPECLSVGQSPEPVHTAHVHSRRDRHM